MNVVILQVFCTCQIIVFSKNIWLSAGRKDYSSTLWWDTFTHLPILPVSGKLEQINDIVVIQSKGRC